LDCNKKPKIFHLCTKGFLLRVILTLLMTLFWFSVKVDTSRSFCCWHFESNLSLWNWLCLIVFLAFSCWAKICCWWIWLASSFCFCISFSSCSLSWVIFSWAFMFISMSDIMSRIWLLKSVWNVKRKLKWSGIKHLYYVYKRSENWQVAQKRINIKI